MPNSRQCRAIAVLTSSPRQPQGDTQCGIEIVLRLTPEGKPDPQCAGAGEPWRVRRFWSGRPDWNGLLVSDGGERWAIRAADDPDEPFWDFCGRSFRPGEYFTLRQPDGGELSFRIVSVEAI